MLLVSYIQQYFNTSITVLTNQVWKLLIALFKVPNTGAFYGMWKHQLLSVKSWDVQSGVSAEQSKQSYFMVGEGGSRGLP